MSLVVLILQAIFGEVHAERWLLADSLGCRAGEVYLPWPQCPRDSVFLLAVLTPVLKQAQGLWESHLMSLHKSDKARKQV